MVKFELQVVLLSHSNYKNQKLHIYPFYCDCEKLSESFRCLRVSILDGPAHFT